MDDHVERYDPGIIGGAVWVAVAMLLALVIATLITVCVALGSDKSMGELFVGWVSWLAGAAVSIWLLGMILVYGTRLAEEIRELTTRLV